jgi:hypothetical protein
VFGISLSYFLESEVIDQAPVGKDRRVLEIMYYILVGGKIQREVKGAWKSR